MNFSKNLIIKLFFIFISFQLFLNVSKANAAEEIKITYSIFSRTIKVNSLKTFAQEGYSTKQLKKILKATGSPNKEIRSVLNKDFEIPITIASKLVYSEIEKIVLTRPAVEAGESLGFLPGDLQQKVDPYLRPLFDSLHSIFGFDRTNSLIDKGIIEVAPLAFMRGRTLDNSLIILDEAQNTTCSQMRMFLTRLGERSKMVVNGDITQIDLKKDQESGLIEASRIFTETQGIKFCYLTVEDVVRHPLVQKIIEAYQ